MAANNIAPLIQRILEAAFQQDNVCLPASLYIHAIYYVWHVLILPCCACSDNILPIKHVVENIGQ